MSKNKVSSGKHLFLEREKNLNWKGGRTIASNGYILIKVGFNHHLSDIRGYAYEHRLVAEEKLGRRLIKGEQVHHINGVRKDNNPKNIKIFKSIKHHREEHRKRTDMRMIGEDNPVIYCKCGCGSSFNKYDNTGRPRRFVSGHNSRNNSISILN